MGRRLAIVGRRQHSRARPATKQPSERRFFQRGAEVYARYFTRNPQFKDEHYRAFAGEGCPPCDDEWWQRIVAYCIKDGFIKPRLKEKASA